MSTHTTQHAERTRCAVCGGTAYRGTPGWATGSARPWLHTDYRSNTHVVVPVTTTHTPETDR